MKLKNSIVQLFAIFICATGIHGVVGAYSLDSISTGASQYQVKFSGSGTYANGKYYVRSGSGSSGEIYVIDTTTDTLINTLYPNCNQEVSEGGVLVGTILYYSCHSSPDIIALDTNTDTFVYYTNPSGAGFFASGLYFDSKIYFPTQGGSGEIFVLNVNNPSDINDDTIETPIITLGGSEFYGPGVAGSSTLYFASSGNNEVYSIDPTANTSTTISGGTTPMLNALALVNVGGVDYIYTGYSTDINIYDVTNSTFLASIPSSGYSESLFTKIDKGGVIYLYLPNLYSSNIDVVNTSTNTITQINSGHTYDASGINVNGKIYLPYSGGIDIIDTTDDSLTDFPTGNSYAYSGTYHNGKIYFPTSSGGGIDILYLGPQLQYITSTTANGTYSTGESISITANFDQDIAATSTMTVILNTGATVVLSDVTGNQLSGTYVVSGSDIATSDLTVSSISSASVTDILTPATTNTDYIIPVSPNNISDTKDIIIAFPSTTPTPTTAPDLQTISDSGTSNTDNVTASMTPAFDVTCSTIGSVIILYTNNPATSTVAGTLTCTGTGTQTITATSTLAAGLHSITYTETTTPSSESAPSPALDITIDTSAPSAPTITSIGGDTSAPYTTASTTPAVIMSAEDGTTVTISGYTCSPTPVSSSTVTCTPTSPLSPGTQSITPTITDAAGNTTVGTSTPFLVASVPSAPVNLSTFYAGTGNGTLTLSWQTPVSDGGSPITVYSVEYRPNASSTWQTIATTTALQTLVSGLNGGQFYDFRVSAVNAVGTGAPSNILNTAPAILSGGGGSYSYTTPTTNTQATTTPTITPTTPVTPHKGLLGGGEPNIPQAFQGQVCKRYMRRYILPGANNNPEEVSKLQAFLNEHGEKLAVDGIYNQDDIDAVKRFQNKYKNQILSPWGIEEATGRVYRTTTAKINLMMCGDPSAQYFTEYLKVGDVSLESVRVQDFLNLIFSPISGYPNNGLPLTTTFTKETAQKLKEYQSVYKTTVLEPWNLTTPTGWFYQTTRASANALIGYSEGEVRLDNGKSIIHPIQ